MTGKFRFRCITVICAVLLVLLTLGSFKVYAFPYSFSDYWLSSSGGVVATFDSVSQVLTISGKGTIEYDRWVKMAQKINPTYFASRISWDAKSDENMMGIVFEGEPKTIKLPGTEKYRNGLFAGFSGKIRFNNAVDLAPSVTDTSYMFAYTPQFNELVDFKTSNVKNMMAMFGGATVFNQPVNFDTRSVTNMRSMFWSARAFNQRVYFDTHNVTDMRAMFMYAIDFNQPTKFDTRNVTNMSNMFRGAKSFNQPVYFDTRNVTNMRAMFSGADRFNQPVDFDTRNVTDMRFMFLDAKVFDQPVKFDTHKVTDMSYMFSSASVFNQPVNFDTLNVTNMRAMFRGADKFNQPVKLDTRKVTDMRYMFSYASNFNQLVNFDTGNVTDMSFMFFGAKEFNQLVKFDTRSVTNMEYMFCGADKFNQPVKFDTRNVTNMRGMFRRAGRFNQPVNFDTGNVVNMNAMFARATAFNQPVDFDTSQVTDMAFMFNRASAFKQPIFFDISSLQRMQYMFRGSAVEQIILSNRANHQNIAANHAFKNCANLYYLSFNGLKNASITGFSDDYYVEPNGANSTLIARQHYQGFNFDDNKVYRAFLQSASSGYSGFKLSADGGVEVNYQAIGRMLRISGAGIVKYDGWVAMARLIWRDYFDTCSPSWCSSYNERLHIMFFGQPKAIKLCGTERPGNGLFRDFNGIISLNDVVDLAPDVTDTSYMFSNAPWFACRVDFDTRNVTNMSHMFYRTIRFNDPVNLDTRNVEDMSSMFSSAIQFNQPLDFDTRNVKDMSKMLSVTDNYKQPIDFDISSAENMESMFFGSAIEQVRLKNSAHQQNINAANIFKSCRYLEDIQFSGLINATIEGFSGDYYVEENGGQPTAHNAADPYVFTDNQSYHVYLQN